MEVGSDALNGGVQAWLDAGYPMRSMLLSPKWAEPMRGLIEVCDAPVYVGAEPLLEAVTYNKLGAATLLLERGADANLADANGTTPLMVVAEGNGYIKSPTELIFLLLAHGAKRELTDSQGRTALARATAAKNTAAIDQLSSKK